MEEKVGFFKRLRNGLEKTRKSFVSGVDSLFNGFSEIDDDFYEELEEILISADISVSTAEEIVDEIRAEAKHDKIKDKEYVPEKYPHYNGSNYRGEYSFAKWVSRE